MNAPILMAQLQGTNQQGGTPRHIKLEKPQGGATVTVYLQGTNQLDFSDIASEKLTFVRVGDKLVILFDNGCKSGGYMFPHDVYERLIGSPA